MGQIGSRGAVRRRLTITALAVTLGAAACSSGSGGTRPVSLRGSSAGVTATGPDAPGNASGTGPATTTTPAPADTAPASTTATTPGHPAATTANPQPTATTRPPTTAPPVATAASGGPSPAATGTYTYGGSGSTTITSKGKPTTFPAPAQSTLVVSAGAQGPGSEQWNNASTIVSNLVFNDSGVFLTSEVISFGGSTTTCTFGSPVPMPPWPLVVGKSFSGQATCGSGSSTGTFSLVGQVQATAGQSVGGTQVAAFKVHSTLSMSGLTVDETDWYAPSLRLPVASATVMNGTLGTSSLTSSTTYTLLSPVPS